MADEIYSWSGTASSNGTADAGIDFAEGQAPGSLNNSGRTVMKRLRDFIADTGFSLTAGGSADALTITANVSFTTLATGRRVAFKAASVNTGAATLNANAIGAKKLIKITASGEADLGAGDIVAGGRYIATYDSTADTGTGAWILQGGHINMPRAGGTFTGAVRFPSGSAAAPGVAVGEATSGLYRIGSGNIGIALSGVKAVDFAATAITYENLSGAATFSVQGSGGAASVLIERYQDTAAAAQLIFRTARGSKSSPAVVAANDQVLAINAQAHNGSTFNVPCQVYANVVAATPSASDMEATFSIDLAGAGSVSAGSMLHLRRSLGLCVNSTTLATITALRHLRLRPYTVGTLPSPTSNEMIYVSNEAGGATIAFADGSNWRRVQDRAVVS